MRRHEHRRTPVEPVLFFWILRHGTDALLLTRVQVDEVRAAALRIGVDRPVVLWIDGDVEPVAVRNVDDVVVRNAQLAGRPARDGPRAVVLRAAVNPVRVASVDVDVVVLADGKVVDELPGPAPVVRKVEPTVA